MRKKRFESGNGWPIRCVVILTHELCLIADCDIFIRLEFAEYYTHTLSPHQVSLRVEFLRLTQFVFVTLFCLFPIDKRKVNKGKVNLIWFKVEIFSDKYRRHVFLLPVEVNENNNCNEWQYVISCVHRFLSSEF